mgnify:FL=1
MKPRIYKSRGMWICFVLQGPMRKSAMGETAREAYGNWCRAYAPLVAGNMHPGAVIYSKGAACLSG